MEHDPILDDTVPTNRMPSLAWGWRDVVAVILVVMTGLVVLLLALAAGVALTGPASTLDSLSPVHELTLTLLMVYPLWLLGISIFAARRAGWVALGVRLVPWQTLAAVPVLLLVQFSGLVIINGTIEYLSGGAFENPQIAAFSSEVPTGAEEQIPVPPLAANDGNEREEPLYESGHREATSSNDTVSRDATGQPPTPQVNLSLPELLVLLVIVAGLVPVVEELFFRGMIYPLLHRRWGTSVAIVASATIFAICHFIPILMPGLFFVGLILGFLREWSKSVVPGIVLHSLQNGIFLVVITTVFSTT